MDNIKLKICLWNATSLTGKELELNNFLVNRKFDIALINETWFNPVNIINFCNYNMVRQDVSRIIAGGVAILIHKELKFNTLPLVVISGCEILLIKFVS